MNELPRTVKVATVWMLLALCLFLAVQWWQQRAQRTLFQVDGDVVEIRRGADGHYHWPGSVNGQAVDFLIDTGASGTALPLQLARALRLETLGSVQSNTAGGVVNGDVVRGDLVLQGGLRVERLRMAALPGLAGNPLLGMDVLSRLNWQQGDGVLRIDLRTRR
jgi:aspartyl protease family protein